MPFSWVSQHFISLHSCLLCLFLGLVLLSVVFWQSMPWWLGVEKRRLSYRTDWFTNVLLAHTSWWKRPCVVSVSWCFCKEYNEAIVGISLIQVSLASHPKHILWCWSNKKSVLLAIFLVTYLQTISLPIPLDTIHKNTWQVASFQHKRPVWVMQITTRSPACTYIEVCQQHNGLEHRWHTIIRWHHGTCCSVKSANIFSSHGWIWLLATSMLQDIKWSL